MKRSPSAEWMRTEMRVPEYPPKPVRALSTLQEYLEAGVVVVSHCSACPGSHQHVVDLVSAIERGEDEPDYAWKVSQRCPECCAPGGGISLQSTSDRTSG